MMGEKCELAGEKGRVTPGWEQIKGTGWPWIYPRRSVAGSTPGSRIRPWLLGLKALGGVSTVQATVARDSEGLTSSDSI